MVGDGPVRVFIRMVTPDSQVIDAVGTAGRAEMTSVIDDMMGMVERFWLLGFEPSTLKITAWRISDIDAGVNWDTGPNHIPSTEQIQLGKPK